jgi:hypothetical protein
MFMKVEVLVFQFSLRSLIEEFGFWFVRSMDHSGLLLYPILHPKERPKILSDAKSIGLEVNLPTGIGVWESRDDLDKGRKKKKGDLVFRKKEYYHLVEVIDKKRISSKDKAKVEEKARRFRERFSASEKSRVIPIIVHPKESLVQAFKDFMCQKS